MRSSRSGFDLTPLRAARLRVIPIQDGLARFRYSGKTIDMKLQSRH
jgi:hypothetical protein